MAKNKGTLVDVLRHSIKETKDKAKSHMLSAEGVEAAVQHGYTIGTDYQGYNKINIKGSDFQAKDGYMGRAVETALAISMGARINVDTSSLVDQNLVPNYSEKALSLYPEIVVKQQKGELAYVLATADESFGNAYGLAKFIDSYKGKDEGTATLGVSHSTSIVALAYLLTNGDADTSGIPISELTGIRVKYDGKTDVSTISIDYANGKEVQVKGSIADHVKKSWEKQMEKLSKKKAVTIDEAVLEEKTPELTSLETVAETQTNYIGNDADTVTYTVEYNADAASDSYATATANESSSE